MGHFGSARTTYNVCPSCESARRSNPDPSRFEIKRIEEHGKFMLLEVVYPNCTNYEGRKYLLMKRMTTIELLAMKQLDPHFAKDGRVLARFEPTPAGWEMGRALLRWTPQGPQGSP